MRETKDNELMTAPANGEQDAKKAPGQPPGSRLDLALRVLAAGPAPPALAPRSPDRDAATMATPPAARCCSPGLQDPSSHPFPRYDHVPVQNIATLTTEQARGSQVAMMVSHQGPQRRQTPFDGCEELRSGQHVDATVAGQSLAPLRPVRE